MRRTLFLVLLPFVIQLNAQTYVTGTISGETWTLGGSPYIVTGDILVASLTIDPGVTVEFNGDYVFEVAGTLTAVGTEQDSIHFTKADTASGWEGIYFNFNPPGSELAYVRIDSSVNSGIRINHSNPIIRECLITGNSAETGGGINVINVAEFFISDCMIIANTVSSNDNKGGGIYVVAPKIVIQNCDISFNLISWRSSGYGGGIYAVGDLEIIDCVLKSNSIWPKTCDRSITCSGGGVYSDGKLYMKNCLLVNNLAFANLSWCGVKFNSSAFGGGVYARKYFNISNSIFLRNEVKITSGAGTQIKKGSGFYAEIEGDSSIIANSTFAFNKYEGLNCTGDTAKIMNSIFWDNVSIQLGGAANISYSDVQNGFQGEGNINFNPLFQDTSNVIILDGSPCIDKGNPDPVYNDVYFPPSLGTVRNDMGATGGPFAGNWQGKPTRQIIGVDPHQIDFGNVAKHQTVNNTLLITNSGDLPVNISSVMLTGIDPAYFTVDDTPFSLDGQSSRELEVGFTPDSSYIYSANLEFVMNTGSVIISLAGTGGVPHLSASMKSINFGDVFLNRVKDTTLTISNTGLDELDINNITLNKNVFSVDTTRLKIPAGESRNITITFSPDVPGNQDGIVTINSNDRENDPYEIPLSGIGAPLQPRISTSSQSIDFGIVPIDSTKVLPLIIFDEGIHELIISSMSINKTVFSIAEDSLEILPSGQYDLEISFSPVAEGSQQGSLTIISNDPNNSPYVISLTGTGMPKEPRISSQSKSINFGNVVIDSTTVVSIKLSNLGIDELIVSDIISDNVVFSADTTALSIAGGQDFFLPVSFTPDSEGIQQGTLSIQCNDPLNSPYIMSLNGTGVPVVEPVFQPTDLLFTNITQSSFTVSFTPATGAPGGYLAIRKTGSFASTLPEDNNAYNTDETIGDGIVAYSGSAATFDQSGLSINTKYYYQIYSYNFSGDLINYLQTNPLKGSQQTVSDSDPPTISSVTVDPEPADLNTPIIISAVITDNNQVSRAVLYYRKGTQVSFQDSVIMTISSGKYSGSIPAAFVTDTGLLYAIIARDSYGNKNRHEGTCSITLPAGEISTADIAGNPFQSGFPRGEWRMFSVPVKLDNDDVSQVLSDFGPSGDETWRLFAGPDNDVSTSARFSPGKAFWFKHLLGEGGKQVSLGLGKTTNLEDGKITLLSGWNQIGNPYMFAVNWAEDTDALQNNQIVGPIRYDGTQYLGVNQAIAAPITELLPFDGYFVYNRSLSNQILTINPVHSDQIAKIAISPISENRTDKDWHIQFLADAGIYKDSYNYIGSLSDASDYDDLYDLPEMPVMGQYVSLFFEHEDNNGNMRKYTIDYKEFSEDGYVWTMYVRSNNQGYQNHLKWNRINFPENYKLDILDVTHNRIVPVEDGIYEFANRSEKYPVIFVVIAGEDNFVRKTLEDEINKLPSVFDLDQNYPNPFNSSTKISFRLKQQSQISLAIYNILGEKVKTLMDNQIYPTGMSDIDWDGTRDQGGVVSSGVYFYRLFIHDERGTGSFVRSRKMILLK